MHLIDLVLEAGQQGQLHGQAAEGAIDHKAEADNPTEEAQAVTQAAVTAEVPHKTAIRDHQDIVDAAQHPTDTRSATSFHPYLTQKPTKVSYTLTWHQMATDSFIWPCNSSLTQGCKPLSRLTLGQMLISYH